MIRNLLLGGVLVLSGSLPALGAAGTCPGEGQIKSASTDISTEITFTNNSGAPRQVFWIDFEGVRVQYGNIAPGASHIQPTFLGHTWLIADKDADCLGLYFAETAPRTVSLGGSDGRATGPVGTAPPRAGNTPPRGTPAGGARRQAEQPPAANDGNPCEANEYWNRSRNLCINTATKSRRKPSAALPGSGSEIIRGLRCRPGFVQSGSRCIRGNSTATRPQPPSPQQPAPGNNPWNPGTLVADPDNEENRPDDLCGPGFTDIGGGCISNSLLNRN